MRSPCLVFDIETIPDVDAGRAAHPSWAALSDGEVAQGMMALQKAKTGRTFLPHLWHRVVAISVLLATETQCRLWTVGQPGDDEKTLIERFFSGIEQYVPTLVSFNGKGFDAPVLHYRAMRHGLSLGAYWDQGQHNPQFKYNNYLNRYHQRHLDIMDVLSNYQMRAATSLDKLATLLGWPGKHGMDGAQVWPAFQAGDIQGIRDYCESDVLNTYLVYLSLAQLHPGREPGDYDAALSQVLQHLQQEQRAHLAPFESAIMSKLDNA